MKNIVTAQQEGFMKQVDSFGSHSLIIGVLLILLGAVGILLPEFMSVFTLGLLSGILIVGGVFWAYHTYVANPRSFIDWLKPFVLVLSGILLVAFPAPGVASLALIITFYFILDSYSSFALAHARYPGKGWGWMVFNGVADLGLVGLFLYGWPRESALLVGLVVGISLLFDGWALIVVGWVMRKLDKEKTDNANDATSGDDSGDKG